MSDEKESMKKWILEAGFASAGLYAGLGMFGGLGEFLAEPKTMESDRIYAEMAEHARLALFYLDQAKHFSMVHEAVDHAWEAARPKWLGDFPIKESATIVSTLIGTQHAAAAETYRILSNDYHDLYEEHRAKAEDAKRRRDVAKIEEEAAASRVSSRIDKLKELGLRWDRCSVTVGGKRCGEVGVFLSGPEPKGPLRYCEACAASMPKDATMDPLSIQTPFEVDRT